LTKGDDTKQNADSLAGVGIFQFRFSKVQLLL